MYFKQDGAISSLRDKLLKLVDQFIYHGSNISSTESDLIQQVNNHTGIWSLL